MEVNNKKIVLIKIRENDKVYKNVYAQILQELQNTIKGAKIVELTII